MSPRLGRLQDDCRMRGGAVAAVRNGEFPPDIASVAARLSVGIALFRIFFDAFPNTRGWDPSPYTPYSPLHPKCCRSSTSCCPLPHRPQFRSMAAPMRACFSVDRRLCGIGAT